MYKLFVLFGLLAIAFAAPKPEPKPLLSHAVLTSPVTTSFTQQSKTVHHVPITTYAAAPVVAASVPVAVHAARPVLAAPASAYIATPYAAHVAAPSQLVYFR